jgi:hypothetical protein
VEPELNDMKTVKFSAFAKRTNARKAKLAAAGKLRSDEALRNQGTNRTPEKRELLERTESRAQAAGMPAFISRY